MQVLRFLVSVVLAVSVLVLIGQSVDKYLSKSRTTLQHEEPLGPFNYPIISLCGVIADDNFIRESRPLLGKMEHWIWDQDTQYLFHMRLWFQLA